MKITVSLVQKHIKLLLCCLVLTSCGQNHEYLFHDDSPSLGKFSKEYLINAMQLDTKIDIVMVIDNSSSMSSIQSQVVKNATLFFNEFIKRPAIDLNLVLISTDENDHPYLGLKPPFGIKNIGKYDPTAQQKSLNTFTAAVKQLGVQGDSRELVLYNVKRVLELAPNLQITFPRNDAHLIIIMITDEDEQSEKTYGKLFAPTNFIEYLQNVYVGPKQVLRFYAALELMGLDNCKNAYAYPQYKASILKKLVDKTEGFTISACTDKFGQELARIGEDIISILSSPSLLLTKRPNINSLKMYYKGHKIPAGPFEDGGVWFYEEHTNTINFYNLDFIQDTENDKFQIDFDIDDGIQRHIELKPL